MDWDDDWWQLVIGAFLILLCVGLIVMVLKRCRGGKRRQHNEVLVQPVSTIQGAYVTSPQYNPAYQHQNVYQNNDSFGWNVTDINQQQPGGVNIRTNTDRILILPRAPIGYPASPAAYGPPPPYTQNP